MSTRVELVVIDPQESFCNPDGELFVKGADADIVRISTMVDRLGSKLDDIHVTLDSHHLFDIAHPIFWKDSSGNHPNPFTIITVDDVVNGVWTTTIPSMLKRATDYVKALTTNNRYPLCVWPPHCLISSFGHCLVPSLMDALLRWEEQNIAMVDYVTKGSNIYTEHYSAIKADVTDPEDPTTQINTKLIQTLMESDLIVIAGEAGSHCLNFTVRDIAEAFGDNSYISKMVLLTDATSPVTGFESHQENFIKDMTAKGMRLSTTTEFLA